jgi:DNA topoisomerase-2
MHSAEELYVPESIFGSLLTSSNFDKNKKEVTSLSAQLCSSKFIIETSSSTESGNMFKQTWTNNKHGKYKITPSKKNYTEVTFKPDLASFNMTHLDDDIVALMTRRAYDIAGCKGITAFVNDEELPIMSSLYLNGQPDEETEYLRQVAHEIVNPHWEVCVTASSHGFQQSSFVNSIATTKGGTHVTLVVDQVVSKVLEVAKKKNKGGMDLKSFHIREHLCMGVY